jgi:hypothetical protein
MMKKILLSIILLTSFSTGNAAIITVEALTNSTGGTGTGFATGINFAAGDHFTATAGINDLWNAGSLPRWSNADGLVGDLFATGTDESGEAVDTLIGRDFGLHTIGSLSLAFGTLVGSLDGNFFAMGTSFDGNAIADGELLLWYWDSNSGDNTESIRVTIETTNVPEPSIIALFALGLFGLGFARRRKA